MAVAVSIPSQANTLNYTKKWDVGNQKKCGHTRINLKLAKALPENSTVLLYASFPAEIKVDVARNILLKFYKREEQVLKMGSHSRWIRNIS